MVLKVGLVEVQIVQLALGEYAVHGVEGKIVHILEPEILEIVQTLEGAVLHVEDVGVVFREDQLGALNLAGCFQLTG